MDLIFDENSQMWWPTWEERIQGHYDYHVRHLRDLDIAMRLCKHKRTAIQAGGNVGVWPIHMAKSFKSVWTAEPDPDLAECLKRNCEKEKNISVVDAALGESHGTAKFYRNGKSGTGTMAPVEDKVQNPFDVKVITIDSLALRDVDLIYLDIEGYEEFALKGAVKTITKWKPLVVCEAFDRTREGIDAIMTELGYKEHRRRAKDVLYVPI